MQTEKPFNFFSVSINVTETIGEARKGHFLFNPNGNGLQSVCSNFIVFITHLWITCTAMSTTQLKPTFGCPFDRKFIMSLVKRCDVCTCFKQNNRKFLCAQNISVLIHSTNSKTKYIIGILSKLNRFEKLVDCHSIHQVVRRACHRRYLFCSTNAFFIIELAKKELLSIDGSWVKKRKFSKSHNRGIYVIFSFGKQIDFDSQRNTTKEVE